MPLGMALVMMACNEEELPRPGYSKAEINSTLTNNSGTSASPNERIEVGALAISEFTLGTQEVNMMYLPESAVEAGVTLDIGTLKTNIDAQIATSSSKPQTLTLASGGEVKKTKIGEGETPNGIYSEITFKLYKNTDAAGSAAANKSLLITGDLEGTPVQIWLEGEEMIRATSKSAEGYQIDGQSSLLVTFNTDKIFANVNFDTASDFDQNGTIEIGPNNADANGSLYSRIKTNFESSVEFVKE